MGILGRYLATRLAVRPELAYTMIKPACIAFSAVLLQLFLSRSEFCLFWISRSCEHCFGSTLHTANVCITYAPVNIGPHMD